MRWGLFTASERNRDRGVQASVQADMSDEERKASDVERECSDSAEEPFNHFGNDEGGGIRIRIPKSSSKAVFEKLMIRTDDVLLAELEQQMDDWSEKAGHASLSIKLPLLIKVPGLAGEYSSRGMLAIFNRSKVGGARGDVAPALSRDRLRRVAEGSQNTKVMSARETDKTSASFSTLLCIDSDFALQRERKRNDGSSYQTWQVARVCRLIANVGKRQVNYLQPVDTSVPPSSPIHITAQFYSETGGMFTLGPVDLTAVYGTRSVIAVLQMQTRDPKIISHTGQVESEATYTIHPDDRAMLCDYIARLPSAPKTAVSASKAGRRSRSREAMGPPAKRRRSEEEPEDVCAALARGLCKYNPAFKGESLWIFCDGSCRGIFHKCCTDASSLSQKKFEGLAEWFCPLCASQRLSAKSARKSKTTAKSKSKAKGKSKSGSGR
jgi:hypothetical protein